MNNYGEIIIYQTEDGLTKINVNMQDETVWLSLYQMAELFQRDKSTISRHIKKIFEEGELQQDSVVANFATTAADGKVYKVDYYNLDVIISVGYRVKSQRGVQFRIWATNVLKEYMIKGFAMDDERLKGNAGGNYCLPDDISAAGLVNKEGQPTTSLGEVVSNAMQLIEDQSEQLTGVLPKCYTDFSDVLLSEILRIFNNSALDEVDGDIIGRIYEYFLNKFAKNIASDDGVFFTPKSLVKMIVNIIEPKSGILLDPACGSGGMFIQSGDFVNQSGVNANSAMTFYGQEKVEYNAQLCLMNMAVHGFTGVIKSGDEANSFYHDAHNLDGCCDYVMANLPFNVDKVKAESCENAKRLPFGMPELTRTKKLHNLPAVPL